MFAAVLPAAVLPAQQRADAEAARKALDGLVLHGMEMRVGWGKAVPLPPVPLYSGTGVPTGPLTGRRVCVERCAGVIGYVVPW